MNFGRRGVSQLFWTRVQCRPLWLRSNLLLPSSCRSRSFSSVSQWNAPEEVLGEAAPQAVPPPSRKKSNGSLLPTSCPGCGALTQLEHHDEAGYYSLGRPSVKAWNKRLEEGTGDSSKKPLIPYCNRCNNLLNNNKGHLHRTPYRRGH